MKASGDRVIISYLSQSLKTMDSRPFYTCDQGPREREKLYMVMVGDGKPRPQEILYHLWKVVVIGYIVKWTKISTWFSTRE